jgi:hypothetical protein
LNDRESRGREEMVEKGTLGYYNRRSEILYEIIQKIPQVDGVPDDSSNPNPRLA